jgi:hypothetical protein
MPPPPKKTATSVTKCDPAQVNQVAKWVLAGASAYDVAEAVAQSFPGSDANALLLEAMNGF